MENNAEKSQRRQKTIGFFNGYFLLQIVVFKTIIFILFQDIINDPELQEFIRTVAEDGIGWAGIYGTKGFPTTLKTRPELVNKLQIDTSNDLFIKLNYLSFYVVI